MDLNKLLDLGVELGYCLQLSGAETYRVEESVNRLLGAYGVECETFAIPNSLIVSIKDENGQVLTQLRRIGYHGTNIDAIERCNTICRKICAEKPDIDTAQEMLKAEYGKLKSYSLPIIILAYLVSSFAFAIFFGANLWEACFAGICGTACGFTLEFMSWLHVNDFFKIISGGFVITVMTQSFAAAGIIPRADAASIGAIMLLVPGLSFTNSMRDIIYGDIVSGTNRLVQVIISAVAIALGTGSAISFCRFIYGTAALNMTTMPDSVWIQCASAFVACLGFCILYNIKGVGMCLCAAGSSLSWFVFSVCVSLELGDYLAGFIAAAVITIYAEVMARIRKFPATSYLIVSLLPLVPGASIYYTIEHLLNDNSEAFSARLVYTAGMAGVLAVGVLLVSSLFRMASTWRQFHRMKNTLISQSTVENKE